ESEKIYVERFGPDIDGKVYITLLNDTTTKQSGKVRLDPLRFFAREFQDSTELISGKAQEARAGIEITLEPQQAEVIELKLGPRP
ncbi:MAG TPA: hypothetical protein VJA21_12865, partial [Verrucomicrobiae bacterium]